MLGNPSIPQKNNKLNLQLLAQCLELEQTGDRKQATVVLLPLLDDLSEEHFSDLIAYLVKVIKDKQRRDFSAWVTQQPDIDPWKMTAGDYKALKAQWESGNV